MNEPSVTLSLRNARERQRKMDNKLRPFWSNPTDKNCARHHENPDAMHEHKRGWTPAPDAAMRRDYDGIIKRCREDVAKRAREFNEQFGGGRAPTGEPARSEPVRAAAPASSPDVWPKWLRCLHGTGVYRFTGPIQKEGGWFSFARKGVQEPARFDYAQSCDLCDPCTQAEALALLRASGHGKAADEFEAVASAAAATADMFFIVDREPCNINRVLCVGRDGHLELRDAR